VDADEEAEQEDHHDHESAFEYRPSVRSPQNNKPASALAGGITPSYRATLCRLQMFPALSLR